MQYGGTERARVSSAAIKRSIRVSDVFATAIVGHIGFRTVGVGEEVVSGLVQIGGYERAQVIRQPTPFSAW
jgi:hypothetical protein